jgi:peptidoglycan-associated lipoprotein
MKIHRSNAPLVVLLGLVTLTAACGKKPVDPVPAPVPDRTATDDAAAREAAERAAREAEEARRRAEAEARAMRATLEEMVYFDYDRSEIRSDGRGVLDGKLPILRATPAIRLRIAGHADERGSTEYNLALGMRRAMTVKDYFVGFGIDAGRLETISFGEERPQAAGHDESAWSRNRRAEFVVTAGMPVTDPEGKAPRP